MKIEKGFVKVTVEVDGKQAQTIEGTGVIGVVAYDVKAGATETILAGALNPFTQLQMLENLIHNMSAEFVKEGLSKEVIFEMIEAATAYGLKKGFESVGEDALNELEELLKGLASKAVN